MNIKQELLKVINKIDKIEEQYKDDFQRLSILDKRVVDLTHFIEGGLNIPNIHPMKLFSELKSVLQERRITKNDISMYDVFFKKGANLKIKDEREELLKRLNNLPKKYHNRYYTNEFKELKDE